MENKLHDAAELTDSELEQVSGGAKSENIEKEGIVVDIRPNGVYKVEAEGHHEIEAHLSGKIRANEITIEVGMRVMVEVSPYDLGRGRIIMRNS